MHFLMAYDWPGNVRELRNAIERAMMLERSSSLTSQHFSSEIIGAGKLEAGAEGSEEGADDCFAMGQIRLPKDGISLDEVEKQLIQMALKRWDGNQTKAAECLRMSRDTLRYRMKKFDINK
jgi:DNA-binding NtrC family response regulator